MYWIVAAIMIAGALGSALSQSFWVLIAFRFVLGFGVGGDFPVSAVVVSEYANRKDRGKLVGMVFGTQALGLIVGPLIALALLGSGASDDVTWRILLALGAVPAAAVIYLRCRMPESPRYQIQVQGKAEQAASRMSAFTGGQVNGNGSGGQARNGSGGQVSENGYGAIAQELGLRSFLTTRRWLITLAGTAGTWFLLDYAYYGNTISTPQILGLISPHASTMTKITPQLVIFVVAAVPGYVLAIATLDRIGHRRLQLTGFAIMALCFLVIAAVPGMTTMVVPFLLVYGVSYFFTEFGPNMTTFVMPGGAVPGEHARHGARDLRRRRQARRVHRGLPVPAAANLPGTARHAAAHRRRGSARLRPHPGSARASRAQPGRHDHQPARPGRPAAAGGRAGPSTLAISLPAC